MAADGEVKAVNEEGGREGGAEGGREGGTEGQREGGTEDRVTQVWECVQMSTNRYIAREWYCTVLG